MYLGKVVFKGEKGSKAVLRVNFTNSGEITGEQDPDMYDDIIDDDGYVYLVEEPAAERDPPKQQSWGRSA